MQDLEVQPFRIEVGQNTTLTFLEPIKTRRKRLAIENSSAWLRKPQLSLDVAFKIIALAAAEPSLRFRGQSPQPVIP
jgi:hypothetical protein